MMLIKASMPPPVAHGGDLWRAMAQYGGAPEEWLDLSTGINPHTYPVPPVPDDIWRCLPDDHDGLNHIAAHYYGLTEPLPLLAVPGSQYAIRHLPALLPPGAVGIAELSYGEYAPAFQRAGHHVLRYRYPGHSLSTKPQDDTADFTLHPDHDLPESLRYLVVVNPNNPTTDSCSANSLLKWRDILHARGGILIVDEAFADVEPSRSVLRTAGAQSNAEGLLVLRSVGKFFGLAGIRAGFVMGAASVLQDLRHQMGAWAVSGPARHAMRHAFADTGWQTSMRVHLKSQSDAMMAMLASHGLQARATSLFIWLPHPHASAVQRGLAQHRIWTRLFAPCAASGGHASLRIGMTSDGNTGVGTEDRAEDRTGAETGATAMDRLGAALGDVLKTL